MIHQPIVLAFVLSGLVAGVLWLEKKAAFRPLFHYLPGAFWCYFLPMVMSTMGWLPEQSAVYVFLTTYVLSACLILLLLNINLPAIFRLGRVSLTAMAVGAAGIAVGAVVAYSIFARWLPPETWKGIGALSASWIGGSANMLAVKEGLQTPDSVFAPMVIVDTVITYSWMGILVALVTFQDRWDNWVGADKAALADVNRRLSEMNTGLEVGGRTAPIWHGIWLLGFGLAIGWLCLKAGERLPEWRNAGLTATGWSFLLVTFVGVIFSLTPISRLERFGASQWGYLCLYLLLAAIGSKARLQYILKAPLLVVMAYVWVLVHAAILATYGFFCRVPMFFLVTSSQANIGGTASTPIVAGVYQPRLATLGLLLAIAGNVIGTYAGMLIAQACRWVHP